MPANARLGHAFSLELGSQFLLQALLLSLQKNSLGPTAVLRPQLFRDALDLWQGGKLVIQHKVTAKCHLNIIKAERVTAQGPTKGAALRCAALPESCLQVQTATQRCERIKVRVVQSDK